MNPDADRRRSSQPGLILQGQPSGPPARLGEWLEAREIRFHVHRVWRDGPLPRAEDFRFVAMLGSAHSVNQDLPQWIPQVRQLIGDAIDQDIPVLGICFGAQALARALGGEVGPMPVAEILWQEVDTEGDLVPSGPWIVWHYDAFTVPAGAVELARTELGPLAFRAGRHLGVQFHAEAPPTGPDRWIEEEREALEHWGVDAEALGRRGWELEERTGEAARLLFGRWWEQCVEGNGAGP